MNPKCSKITLNFSKLYTQPWSRTILASLQKETVSFRIWGENSVPQSLRKSNKNSEAENQTHQITAVKL